MYLLNATLLLAVLAFTSNASPMSNYGEDVKQALSMPENATDDQVKAALFGLFRGCPFDNEACAQSVQRTEEYSTIQENSLANSGGSVSSAVKAKLALAAVFSGCKLLFHTTLV